MARETGVGLRTLERWKARYRAHGFAGLEPPPRADAGTHRLPADLIRVIEGLALSKPRPSIATVHRKVTGICGIRDWPIPSYSVVWDMVRSLDPGMVTLALEGAASYPNSTNWCCADRQSGPTRCGRPTTPCSTSWWWAPTADPPGHG